MRHSGVMPKERCDVMIEITLKESVFCASNFIAEVRGGFISFSPCATIVAHKDIFY